MKAYIVMLAELPESVQVAERAAQSCRQFNLEPVFKQGVWRDKAMAELEILGLRKAEFDESWSNPEAVIGNFVAQCRIWNTICASKEPALILEHDAVVVAPIPHVPPSMHIVNFGKPSFGKLKKLMPKGQFQPLFSKPDKLPGAHGYYLTPRGAELLLDAAQEFGAMPVDVFIDPRRFPIHEYYPWPIEAHDSFTTIQRVKGCRSKHNWNAKYRII